MDAIQNGTLALQAIRTNNLQSKEIVTLKAAIEARDKMIEDRDKMINELSAAIFEAIAGQTPAQVEVQALADEQAVDLAAAPAPAPLAPAFGQAPVPAAAQPAPLAPLAPLQPLATLVNDERADIMRRIQAATAAGHPDAHQIPADAGVTGDISTATADQIEQIKSMLAMENI